MGSYRVDSPPLRNTFDYSWAFPKVVVGRCTRAVLCGSSPYRIVLDVDWFVEELEA